MARIGIIGSGNVGGALGQRWAAEGGHSVLFASRTPDSAEMRALAAAAGSNARATPPAEAMAQSDVLLVATPWPATESVIRSAAATGALDDKVLIDATNPLAPDLSGLAVQRDQSGAELMASWAPRARVVKAFNSVGYNIMEDPRFEGGRAAVMFYCGDDAEAKRTVHQLAGELGFDAVDTGPLSQARLLEPFALLWVSLAIRQGLGREFAFSLMRRADRY